MRGDWLARHVRGNEKHDTYTIHIPNHSGDSREARTSTRYDTHVFVRILACFAFPVIIVVKVRYRLTERWSRDTLTADRTTYGERVTFNTGGGGILQRINRHRNTLWARQGTWNRADLWSALAQVCPLV